MGYLNAKFCYIYIYKCVCVCVRFASKEFVGKYTFKQVKAHLFAHSKMALSIANTNNSI